MSQGDTGETCGPGGEADVEVLDGVEVLLDGCSCSSIVNFFLVRAKAVVA